MFLLVWKLIPSQSALLMAIAFSMFLLVFFATSNLFQSLICCSLHEIEIATKWFLCHLSTHRVHEQGRVCCLIVSTYTSNLLFLSVVNYVT